MRISLPSFIIIGAVLTCSPLFGQGSGGQPPRNPPTGKEPQKSPINKTGDVTYEMGGVLFNSETREVRVPCNVNMKEGAIEYALVTVNGKTHESLLKTKVKPFDIQVALLLCHYEPNPNEIIRSISNPFFEQNDYKEKPMAKPGANRVKLSVEWKDKDGKAQTDPLSNWIHNRHDDKALEIPYWIFSGSDIGDGIFSAELDGSLISIHYDLVAIIGSCSKLIGNDENWELDTKRIPPIDTPVTLVIAPFEPVKK